MTDQNWVYRALLENTDDWHLTDNQFLGMLAHLDQDLQDEYRDTIDALLEKYCHGDMSTQVYEIRDGYLCIAYVSTYLLIQYRDTSLRVLYKYDEGYGDILRTPFQKGNKAYYTMILPRYTSGNVTVQTTNARLDYRYIQVRNRDELLKNLEYFDFSIKYEMANPVKRPITKNARKH